MTTPIDHTTVDAAFPVRGGRLPLDHGFTLFSALSRVLPAIHENASWGIHPVFGQRVGHDALELLPNSRIKVRLPLAQISAVLPLSKATIEVAGSTLALGFLQVLPLTPAAHLRARLVTIRGFQEEEGFLAAVRRQIEGLEGLGQDPATIDVELGRRRIFQVHGRKVVGFAVGLTGLEIDASLTIQRVGLGGRRHMGAGLFMPPGRRG